MKVFSKKGFLFALLVFGLFIFAIYDEIGLGESTPLSEKVSEEVKGVVNSESEFLVPNFVMSLEGGVESSFYQRDKKLTILNFWASWCEPCKKEFPEIIELVKKHKDKIQLLAISSDENREDYEKFLKELESLEEIDFSKTKLPITFYLDQKGEIAREKFNASRLPETFFVDVKNRILKKVSGSREWLNGEVSTFVNTLPDFNP